MSFETTWLFNLKLRGADTGVCGEILGTGEANCKLRGDRRNEFVEGTAVVVCAIIFGVNGDVDASTVKI